MKSLAFAGMGIVGLAGFLVLANQFDWVPQAFGADADPLSSHLPAWSLLTMGYVCTLLGAVAGAMLRGLQAERDRGVKAIRPGPFFRRMFVSLDLWLSIMASPIAYVVIWKALDVTSVSSLITVAFQNGLSCTVLAGGLVNKPAATD